MSTHFVQPADGFVLYHQSLTSFKGLLHGFSLRCDPQSQEEKSLGFNGYQPRKTVEMNRKQFLDAIVTNRAGSHGNSSAGTEGSSDVRLVCLNQTHSHVIHCLRSAALDTTPVGDGLSTDQPNVLLSVLTADCVPILIAEPGNRLVAAVHAGWRGTLKRIVEKAVGKMKAELSANPANCLAVVGPSIRSCCYEIGENVFQAFASEFPYASALFKGNFGHPAEDIRSHGESKVPLTPDRHDGRKFLDLPAACEYQLRDAGLLKENIHASPFCTSCENERFFSHRRESGRTGRMMAVIGMTRDFTQSST